MERKKKSGVNRKSKEEHTCRKITILNSILHPCLAASTTLVRLELTNPSRKTSCITAKQGKSDDSCWAKCSAAQTRFLGQMQCSYNNPAISIQLWSISRTWQSSSTKPKYRLACPQLLTESFQLCSKPTAALWCSIHSWSWAQGSQQ